METPRVYGVMALSDHRLLVFFEQAGVRVFDAQPYVSRGIFTRIAEDRAFRNVTVGPAGTGVVWSAGPDLSAGTLYAESSPAPIHFAAARDAAHEAGAGILEWLAERTGIGRRARDRARRRALWSITGAVHTGSFGRTAEIDPERKGDEHREEYV